jgi:hypothetical protein
MSDGLRRYLERAAVDLAFRDLALADPARSFQGFGLSASEQDLLLRRDARVLGLSVDAAAAEAQPARPAAGSAPGEVTPTAPPLSPVELLLRLVVVPRQLADGALHLEHHVSLHALPAAGAVLPPSEAVPAGAPAPVDFHVTLLPRAALQPGGRLVLSFEPRIRPLGESAPPAGVAASASSSPWNHRLQGEAVSAAAAAVHAAAPAERQARLLELIQAMTPGEDRP